MKNIANCIVVALGLAMSSSALAEDPYAPSDDTTTKGNHGLLTKLGVGVSVGGGVSNFTKGAISDVADVGGAWTARVSVGTRAPLALEAAYIGTANGLNALGLDNRAVLLGNGVEGALRLNLTTTNLQPYIFAGAAWKHYSVVNENFNTSSLKTSDNVLEVPVGAGIAYHYQGFMFDARGDFRPSFDNDLIGGPISTAAGGTTSTNGNLQSWSATARVGFEF